MYIMYECVLKKMPSFQAAKVCMQMFAVGWVGNILRFWGLGSYFLIQPNPLTGGRSWAMWLAIVQIYVEPRDDIDGLHVQYHYHTSTNEYGVSIDIHWNLKLVYTWTKKCVETFIQFLDGVGSKIKSVITHFYTSTQAALKNLPQNPPSNTFQCM